MKFSSKRSKKNSAGFIISLEFLLVMALVVFPIMIGLFLLGRKVVTLYLNYIAAVEQPLSRPVVWDSSDDGSGNAKPVGPVIGYDQFSAPLILYRDAGPIPGASAEFKPGVLMGVRAYRFTTRSRVYYQNLNCDASGNAYVVPAFITASMSASAEIDFISELQGINYAVGNGNILYREASLPSSAGTEVVVQSYWNSQETADLGPESKTTPPSCTAISMPTSYPIQSLGESLGDTTGTIAAPGVALHAGDPFAVTGATCPGYNYNPGVSCSVSGTDPCSGFNAAGVLKSGTMGNTFVYTSTATGSFPPQPVNPDPGGFCNFTAPYDMGNLTVSKSGLRLVLADEAAGLGTGGGNFTPPFRVAFPTAVPGPPLVTCPGGEGCP